MRSGEGVGSFLHLMLLMALCGVFGGVLSLIGKSSGWSLELELQV
jgi:hypothetical protein